MLTQSNQSDLAGPPNLSHANNTPSWVDLLQGSPGGAEVGVYDVFVPALAKGQPDHRRVLYNGKTSAFRASTHIYGIPLILVTADNSNPADLPLETSLGIDRAKRPGLTLEITSAHQMPMIRDRLIAPPVQPLLGSD